VALYYSEVAYIADLNPNLIRRNAAEFERMDRLLDSAATSLVAAKGAVEWDSEVRQSYDSRMNDAKELATGLGNGFTLAARTLERYAAHVTEAKTQLGVGRGHRQQLAALIATTRFKSLVTASIGSHEFGLDPMRAWDLIATLTLPVRLAAGLSLSEIARGNRYYAQADDAFHRAREAERTGRGPCIGDLRSAYRALPDFRGGLFGNSLHLIDDVPAIADAIAAAADDEDVRLPGHGPKEDGWPSAEDGPVSDELADLWALAGTQDIDNTSTDERTWVVRNKPLFDAVAAQTGLPPELIAGILLKEANDGQADVYKIAVARGLGVIGLADPDLVSVGDTQVQIRRAAEVLGFDSHNITDEQRDEIVKALQDPVMSIFITGEFLEHLKAQSEFAGVPADEMRPEDWQKLAASYNNTEDPDAASGYGSDVQNLGRDLWRSP
jgi:hypothetical protein